jgi:primosomal protein N' (replication factor Y)
VVETSEVPDSALKVASALLDPEPLLDPALMTLATWAASYYHHPPGEVFNAVFPKRLREGKAPHPPGERAWQLTTRGQGLSTDALARSRRQGEAVALLRDGAVAESHLKAAGISAAVLRALRDRDLARECTQPPCPAPASSTQGLSLNPEQAAALQAIVQSGSGFSCHLLEGVTGSGKTEVYLQLIARCLARGEQVLVLIPEIGLTPQTLQRFEQRFSANIVVLHSGLGDARRYRAWEEARAGTAHIVIGTRSAVFTPLHRPGLVIVDEEHDASYKQQDGFRYSARDVAIKRAQLLDCPAILGSATPSLESLANALAGRYSHHRLTQRAGTAELPVLQVLDLRRQPLQAGLSNPLLERIEQALAQSTQVLLFLNRRGYAPTLQCHDCGWVAGCEACDARLTVHRRDRRLRCHHCGGAHSLPRQCPDCHSTGLITAGLGTEQTEVFLRERCEDVPVHRVDSDSMQGRDAMQSLVDTINTGAPCILVGTQMLAKGHHFPGVSLVAVIDADALLFSADFRGEERMAQLLTQVAGRAGRAGVPGSVVLQTHYPDHPALQAMLHSDYASQARELLARRSAAGMPPAGQLLVVRTDCADADLGEEFLHTLRRDCASKLPPGAQLVGPLPSPMQRRAGRFRAQLLMTAPTRRDAQAGAALLVAGAEALPARGGLKWTIDIDPLDVF